MKKCSVYMILLFVLAVVLSGCTNTFKAVQEDTKHNWDTVRKWDDNFKFKWW